MSKPPPRGSVQEYVLQELILHRDRIDYLKTRAIIQSVYEREKADEALKEYKDAQFPYLQKIQGEDRRQHIQKLMSEVGRGALQITPVVQKRVTSRLKTRIVQRSQEEQRESERKLSKKLGEFL